MMNKISSVNDKIAYLIDYHSNGNKKKFAEKIGFSPQVISNIVSGRKSKPSFDVLNAILSTFVDIDPEWLILEKGEMLRSERPVISESQDGIPLIPLDAMAGFGTGEMQVMDYETAKYSVPDFDDLNVDFMIRVKGSSMYPKYNSGDLVACKKLPLSDAFFQWNKVYVLDTIQGPMIKRVHPSEKENHILCVSDNKSYQPFDLPTKEMNALALVVGVIRLE